MVVAMAGTPSIYCCFQPSARCSFPQTATVSYSRWPLSPCHRRRFRPLHIRSCSRPPFAGRHTTLGNYNRGVRSLRVSAPFRWPARSLTRPSSPPPHHRHRRCRRPVGTLRSDDHQRHPRPPPTSALPSQLFAVAAVSSRRSYRRPPHRLQP